MGSPQQQSKKHEFSLPEDIDKFLIKQDIKPSYHRIMILKYLWNNKDHPTVNMIYKSLSKKIPTLSKTTVYNTVTLFQKKRIITSLPGNENELRYDFNTDMHVHFKCIKCDRIYDIEVSKNFSLIDKKELEGHMILDYQICLKGICQYCKKKR